MAESFEDLKVWQNGHKIALEIYHLTSSFPTREAYGLTDQIRRAILSVGANIAEGHGRYHYLDKVKFMYNARGSIEEARNHLIVAKDLGYLNEESFKQLNQELIGLTVGLNKFILTLKNRNSS